MNLKCGLCKIEVEREVMWSLDGFLLTSQRNTIANRTTDGGLILHRHCSDAMYKYIRGSLRISYSDQMTISYHINCAKVHRT